MRLRALQVCVLVALSAASPVSASLGPSLQSKLGKGNGSVRVVILLSASQSALERSYSGRPSAAAETRKQLQRDNEAALDLFFERAREAGVTFSELQVYWLSPAVAACVESGSVAVLDALPGVAAVIEDATVELGRPVREVAAQTAYDATAAGMDAVGVRTLWHQGLTGRGTLIASIDTGVDGLHPALKSHYRGSHSNATEAWRDAEGGASPNDPVGHGTHTMGTVLGCEPSDTVGIAPEAEWIAAGVVDRGRGFSETISDLLGAFQWLADPDGRPETRLDRPDVVLNSWGIPQGVLPACDPTFWQVVDHLEALGTVVVFAAGNEGPGPQTLRQPADRGDGYLSCFSVGAVDAMDPLLGSAPFSSRGPSSCNSTMIKPELVAPGVNVRSCAQGGGYRLSSGTSMAAPYVAGAVCLLRQYNPDATPLEIKQALVQSALDLGPAGPDFGTGYGLLNIPGAIALLDPPQPVAWRISASALTEVPDLSAGFPTSSVEILLENLGRSLRGVEINVRAKSPSTTLQGGSTFAFEFVEEQSGSLTLPVSFQTAGDVAPGDRLWLDLEFVAQSPALDSIITIGIQVGPGPKQSAMVMTAGDLSVVATNVGRFDAQGALAVSVQDASFAYDGKSIPLSGGLEIHTATRDISSFGTDHDFEPAPQGQLLAGPEGTLSAARIRDTRHADPAGVEFNQRVFAGSDGPGAYLLFDYAWQRLWTDGPAIELGSWIHWQPASGAAMIETGARDELCESGDGIYFGCIWLSDAGVTRSHTAYDPDALALPVMDPNSVPTASNSYWSRFRQSGQTQKAGHFALAFIAGHSQEEWQAAAARAREQYAALAGAGEPEVLPQAFRLDPNYPNPFNPATTIRYALAAQARVQLRIFNSLGRHVTTLVQAEKPAGVHEVVWQATDERGLSVPSGTYFIQLTAGDEVRSGKMSLLR